MVLLIVLFGLIIGSFLNVCIYRIPRSESIVFTPSHCPKCNERLMPRDLIPLISYLLSRGNCRYCGEKISFRYPLVELLTGLIFLIIYLNRGLDHFLLKYLLFFSALIIITFIDLEHQIIPNQIILVLIIWAGVWQIFKPEISWFDFWGGAILGGGLLLAVAIISRGGMGGGDVKLMFAAGLFLGSWPTVLALFLAFLTGAFVGIILLALKIKSRKEPLAFGPFLSFGIMIAVLWGNEITGFYNNFLY